MNVTDKQLPPDHRWNCCFGCRCGKILDDKEQKVEEMVDKISTTFVREPIPPCPPTPVIRPVCKRSDLPSPSPVHRQAANVERVFSSKNDSD